MTKILFHSYYYPPIGGSGAQRPLKFSRYLGEFGYEPIVITGTGTTRARWAPMDETLMSEVPPNIEVCRLSAREEPRVSPRWRERAEQWLRLRSEWASWWVDQSVQLGGRVAEDAALVYVWMQPYVSATAGASLSQALGKPWIADLGDPWALDEMMVYPTALHRGMARRDMRTHLGTAAAIVMSTPEATTRLQRDLPELAERPVFTIPNGFDAADFRSALPRRDRSSFRVVHTGHLHTELGRDHRRRLAVRHALGGGVGGLDILTRSHVYLIEAIDHLLERYPTLTDTLEFHIAGVLTEADLEVAARCPVARLHGYVTHAESIELIRTADLLFLPMQDLPPGVRATIVPGKTYEYLASERPILAAVPDGDTRDILTEAGNAIIVRPDDVAGMAEALRSELERWHRGVEAPKPAVEVVSRFEYHKLTEQLAGVFNAVLNSDRRSD